MELLFSVYLYLELEIASSISEQAIKFNTDSFKYIIELAVSIFFVFSIFLVFLMSSDPEQ